MKWILFICLLLGLWFTRPASVMPACEQSNTPELCAILEKE